ncbi:MBL fold metallo-hydrolase [Specibacter cremeus]|uniref:MBL fold metallo-hydrolase n=1 Tax=Specibacter cremeus TaxID=1629051 RepID=UPI000F77A80E|nr:MBL fold metallo-hydrolase [Specibacter cremeus]
MWTVTSPHTRSRRADNPGPMTLDGTNSYVLSGVPGGPVVVVDPGPLQEDHLAGLAASGRVELILVTHWHHDHTAGSARLHELTGAPVRAADPAYCHAGAPLVDGEVVHAAGLDISVLATPGHTGDSLCFFLPDDGEHGSVLTGDTVLGTGSTVIVHPDGRLGDFLASLDRLERLGAATVLPAHGPVLPEVAAVARQYRAHRLERLEQVRAAVALLAGTTQGGPDAEAVTAVVYADVPPELRGAAASSVRAQLEYLRAAH